MPDFKSGPLRNLCAVGERFKCSEAYGVNRGGALGSENVGMSNRKSGESPDRRKPEVSSAMVISGGLGVPKRNPASFLPILIYTGKSVAGDRDGQPVNIPALLCVLME